MISDSFKIGISKAVFPQVLGGGALKHIFKPLGEISPEGVLGRISLESIHQVVHTFLHDNFELLIFIVLGILIALYVTKK